MTDQQKKIGAIVLAVVMGVVMITVIFRTFGGEGESPNDTRTLMDRETRELFEIPVEDLKPYPMKNPSTGKDNLYRTEVCYWGEECRKAGGTHVIMKKLLKEDGPTHCPVCGHIVRFHNPLPPNYRPPGRSDSESD